MQSKERRQSSSPPPLPSKLPSALPLSFVSVNSSNNSNNNVAQVQNRTNSFQKYIPPVATTSGSFLTSNDPVFKQSTAYSNIILPILNQLSTKYKHRNLVSSNNGSTSTSIENVIDELKSSFLYLDQSNPGSLDSLIKNMFQILKKSQQT